jgi:HK97 family phage portal protein
LKLFGKDFSKITNSTTTSLADLSFLEMLGIDGKQINPNRIGEITYWTCLKTLSDKISSLPASIYKSNGDSSEPVKHYLNYILQVQPNDYQNASMFWSTIEYNRNHYGNAFIYVDTAKMGRNAGKVQALWNLNAEQMQIFIDDLGLFGTKGKLWYIWSDIQTGTVYKFNSSQVLHLKSWVTMYGAGIIGLSVRNILTNYVDQATFATAFINNLVKNGMVTDKILLQYTGSLEDKAKTALVNNVENYSKNNSGKFIPLPVGITATNLSSKLTDSQFIELNKYNALQIAGAFSIKPQYLNDYDKGNYANVQLQQDAMYKDCLLPILQQYEQEMAIKLFTQQEKDNGYYINFNIDTILRASFQERLTSYSTAINSGVLTPNEARSMENRASKEGGDDLMMNGAYAPLKLISKGVNYTNNNTNTSAEGGDNVGK